MIMSGKHDRSPEAVEDRRIDRIGWLFAFLMVSALCTVILAAFLSAQSWH